MNHWRKRLVSSAFTFIGPSMLVTGVFLGLAPSQPEKGSRLKRRFDRFASVEYKGKPYLTPRDFLDDITFFHPRPMIKRKVNFSVFKYRVSQQALDEKHEKF